MLNKNGVTLSYDKMQSMGRKWQKPILQAAILENGGYRHSATRRQLSPSEIMIYTFI
jgi:hypothetical protein